MEIPFSQNLDHIETGLLICNGNQLVGFYMKQVFTERCFQTDSSNIYIRQYLLSSFSYFSELAFYLLWVFKMTLWINTWGCWCKYFPNSIKTVCTSSTFGCRQKSFWDCACRSRCSTTYLSSPISLKTNPRYHCTSSSIHTTTNISLTKDLYYVSSITQSKNFDMSSSVCRSKQKHVIKWQGNFYHPAVLRFSKRSLCAIIMLNNVGSIFLLLDVYEHNKTIRSSQFFQQYRFCSEYTILTHLVLCMGIHVLHIWSSFFVHVEVFSAFLILSLICSFCFFFVLMSIDWLSNFTNSFCYW